MDGNMSAILGKNEVLRMDNFESYWIVTLFQENGQQTFGQYKTYNEAKKDIIKNYPNQPLKKIN